MYFCSSGVERDRKFTFFDYHTRNQFFYQGSAEEGKQVNTGGDVAQEVSSGTPSYGDDFRGLPYVHYRGDRSAKRKVIDVPLPISGWYGVLEKQQEEYKLFFSLHEGWVVHESAFIPTS